MTLSRLLRIGRQRTRSLVSGSDLDAEVASELAFHFDRLVEEYIAQGLTPEQAAISAHRALGNVPLVEEQCRDTRGVGRLEGLFHDVLYGLRMLRRSPNFTLTAAVSLAIGIGANAALLSVVFAVLRGPLPFPEPDRLIVFRTFAIEQPAQNDLPTLREAVALSDGLTAL